MILVTKVETNEKVACSSCGYLVESSWSIVVHGDRFPLCKDCLKKLSNDISKGLSEETSSGPVSCRDEDPGMEEFFCPFCDMGLEKSQVILSEDGMGSTRCKRCGTALED